MLETCRALLYGNGKRGIAEITHLNAFLEHICIINADWKRCRLFTGGKWGKFAGREDYLEDYLTTICQESLRDSPRKQIRTIRRDLRQITVEDREIYTGAKTILNICLDVMSPARVPTDVCASTSQLQTSSMTVTSHVLHWNNKQCSRDGLYWGVRGWVFICFNPINSLFKM